MREKTFTLYDLKVLPLFFSASKAIALQRKLSKEVKIHKAPKKINYVAGFDLSYCKDRSIAVAALFKFPSLKFLEYVVVSGRVEIPYVPGLLAFREAPLIFKAFEKLSLKPELVVLDGHGLAHPRKFGIATHVGVALGISSIGVAKKLLYGTLKKVGDEELIIVDNEIVGFARIVGKSKLYVSIGNLITLNELRTIFNNLIKGHNLPEPTFVADKISKEMRVKYCVSKA